MTVERKIVSIVNNLSIDLAKAEERFQILMDSEVTDLDKFNEDAQHLIKSLTMAELTLNKFKSILEKSKEVPQQAPQQQLPVDVPQEAPVDVPTIGN